MERSTQRWVSAGSSRQCWVSIPAALRLCSSIRKVGQRLLLTAPIAMVHFPLSCATTNSFPKASTKTLSTLLLQVQHIPPIRILMAEFIHQRPHKRKAEPTDLRVFDRLRRPFGFPHRRIERIGEITDG